MNAVMLVLDESSLCRPDSHAAVCTSRCKETEDGCLPSILPSRSREKECVVKACEGGGSQEKVEEQVAGNGFVVVLTGKTGL